jgi:hypothetical protein
MQELKIFRVSCYRFYFRCPSADSCSRDWKNNYLDEDIRHKQTMGADHEDSEEHQEGKLWTCNNCIAADADDI